MHAAHRIYGHEEGLYGRGSQTLDEVEADVPYVKASGRRNHPRVLLPHLLAPDVSEAVSAQPLEASVASASYRLSRSSHHLVTSKASWNRGYLPRSAHHPGASEASAPSSFSSTSKNLPGEYCRCLVSSILRHRHLGHVLHSQSTTVDIYVLILWFFGLIADMVTVGLLA
jgi:hypothetical protein